MTNTLRRTLLEFTYKHHIYFSNRETDRHTGRQVDRRTHERALTVTERERERERGRGRERGERERETD